MDERILNELILRLRVDYEGHPGTAKVQSQGSVSSWGNAIEALFAWGVLDDPTATTFNELRRLRNKSVHDGAHLAGSDAREDALTAVLAFNRRSVKLFAAHGQPPSQPRSKRS